MEPGVRESLVTARLRRDLAALVGQVPEVQAVDRADQPLVLARHIHDLTQRALQGMPDERRLTLVNRLVDVLGEASDDAVAEPARQLLRVAPMPGPGVVLRTGARPATPLADAALLTNSPGEPSLGAELRAEIATADEVDLLCAFVKWHGLRVLEGPLAQLRELGIPFRVITSTYIGATERRALDRLVRDFGAEVRVQYDTDRTRLHAKAWLFRRRTRYDTAYVGSSNLSSAALLDGVEWNVRMSRVGTPALFDTFRRTFDRYWNDPSFIPYDPDSVVDRDRLDDALAEASGHRHGDAPTVSLSGLEVRPRPHQILILEALQTERTDHDRHRNLVVAATGTGKTVVAAFDYARLCSEAGRPLRLLFVAHRVEILAQSRRTYREVLGDVGFGELYVAGSRPERWQHVFASVQSLASYGVRAIPTDSFDVVVVDEFHHAQASTYRALLDHLRPAELVGLTATPERADGVNVQDLFGGRIAAELRLWDALDSDLLCPFHYFGISDGTDLTRVEWKRGRYDDAALTALYTGNSARAALILRELSDKVLNPAGMRALGFCVSVAHARYMAEQFTQAGIPARAVSGDTPLAERSRALQDLRERRVNVLFAADLFNEGLDLPDIDTVLFLRPTESATVFLQQLGRGLRPTPTKPVLTVLDFVGQQRREFRFDLKLRALTGFGRHALTRQVEQQFPFLPSGCQIVLDQGSQQAVLENLRTQISNRFPQMTAELRRMGDVTIVDFLLETGLDLADILRNNHSWTELRRSAGLSSESDGAVAPSLLRRARAFSHVDDPLRAEAYRRLLGGTGVGHSAAEQRLARMLVDSIWPQGGSHASLESALETVRSSPALRAELSAVVELVWDQSRTATTEVDSLSDIPLRCHARYSREEILAALDYPRAPSTFREGVYYSHRLNVDALLVTLIKSETNYSPSTMYRDYFISPTMFHWESQSTTTLSSPTGRRYLSGTSTILLFVRQTQRSDLGAAPYVFLGPAHYVEHEGERPIAITWRLDLPAPVSVAADVA